ncbi:MAG TPA: DNA recombination protein RmuC [Bacteroidales bacterium]|nr:DNA recombination protein RmuC [Bacteroidales bacterium]HOR60950.1 DNA recombination protein RmuC [Bacteroidales bacterium]
MEALFLVLGIAKGFLIAWLIFRRKLKLAKQSEISMQELIQAKSDLTKYETENNFLIKQLEETKTSFSNKDSENKELIAKLSIAETNLSNLNEKLETNKAELEQLHNKFTLEFENLANKVLEEKSQKFSELNKKQIDAIINPFNENLKEFKQTVKDTYEKGMKERTELGAELKHIQELNQKLSVEANNLTKALKGDVQKQGRWGEMILEKILESSGLEKDKHFRTQDSFTLSDGRRQRPDAVVYLPENKHIIIDSKVSLVAYEKYVNSDNEEEKKQFLKEHIASVRTHIKELADKDYINSLGLENPEYILMFVPIEASLGLTVSNDNQIFTEAWDKRVVIVSPSTLIATLMTVNAIWKQTMQTENALLIADRGGKLYEKFIGFIDDLKAVGASIEKANKEYEKAMSKLSEGSGNLVRQAEMLKELGAKTTKSIDKEILELGKE